MENLKVPTGSEDLNRWLSGGYDKDIITTIYGPAGSGKTNICMMAAVSQAKNSKVIFIDTEGGFSIDRFKQLAGENYKELLKNVLLLKPTSFDEQKKDFQTLLNQIKLNSKISLIVVDGMTMLYRLEFADSIKDESKTFLTNKELARQLRILAEIARKKNIPVIMTNQVYYDFIKNQDFSQKEKNANMVGGDLLKYWSKCLVELKFFGQKRVAILKKHRSLPEKEFAFTLVDSGIRKKGLF